jgi:DNA polymerase I-like protein with 3'-5' exonuclease and polymerase domains
MLQNDWYQKHVFPALHVHDEIQVIVTDKTLSNNVGESMVNAIIKAGKDLDFNCPLDGEYHIGNNWRETH